MWRVQETRTNIINMPKPTGSASGSKSGSKSKTSSNTPSSSSHSSSYGSGANQREKRADPDCLDCIEGRGYNERLELVPVPVSCSRCHAKIDYKEAKKRLAPCSFCDPNGVWGVKSRPNCPYHCKDGAVMIDSCVQCKGKMYFTETRQKKVRTPCHCRQW